MATLNAIDFSFGKFLTNVHEMDEDSGLIDKNRYLILNTIYDLLKIM
jgi:hypothetical protein